MPKNSIPVSVWGTPHTAIGEGFCLSCEAPSPTHYRNCRGPAYGPSREASSGVSEPVCPACGNPIDYCMGHGPLGDSVGAAILDMHDNDNHSACHPLAECEV